MASIVDPPPDGKSAERCHCGRRADGDTDNLGPAARIHCVECLPYRCGDLDPADCPFAVAGPSDDETSTDSKVYIPDLGGVVELMGDYSNEHDDRFLGHVAGVLYNIERDHRPDGFGCHVCRGDYPACPRLEDAEGVAFAWLIQRVTRG